MEYDVYREFIKAALKDPRMYKVNMPSSQYKYWDDYAKEHGGLGPNYVYPAPKDQVYDSRKHTTDKGKLPWHPTFSDESDYADMAISGHWTGNVYQMAPGMDCRYFVFDQSNRCQFYRASHRSVQRAVPKSLLCRAGRS